LSSSRLKVFLQGSCRIHRPFRALQTSGKVDFLNSVDPCWFSHTARAARQSIEIICGRVAPPFHMRELFFETDDARKIEFLAPDRLALADLLVIEVCTLSSVDVDGWDVNAHRMYSAVKNGDPRADGASKRINTSADIAHEIGVIKEITGKNVMIVNHIGVTGLKAVDDARSSLTRTLEAARQIEAFFLFDTSNALRNVPTELALEDHNHYRREFEAVMGEAMLNFMAQLPISSRA